MTTDPSPESLATLRAAAGQVDALVQEPTFDPTVHAERFEAVHEALVAVLADIEQTADRT